MEKSISDAVTVGCVVKTYIQEQERDRRSRIPGRALAAGVGGTLGAGAGYMLGRRAAAVKKPEDTDLVTKTAGAVKRYFREDPLKTREALKKVAATTKKYFREDPLKTKELLQRDPLSAIGAVH